MGWNDAPIIYEDKAYNNTCLNFTSGEKTYPYTMGSNCEKTIAEENGVIYFVFQFFFLIVYIVIGVMFLARIKEAKEVKDRDGVKLALFCSISSFCLTLSAIDPHGFAGWLPYQVYFIADEVSAASAMSACLLLTDGILRVGRSIQENKKASLVVGLDHNTIIVAHTTFFVIYVVLILICLNDTDNFMFWTGMKGCGGGLTMLISNILVYRTSNVILTAAKSLPEDKQAGLRTKFKRCVRTLAIVSFVLILTGTMDLMADEESRKLTVYSGFGGSILWLIFRVIFVCALLVLYLTNRSANKNAKKKTSKVTPKSTIVSAASPSSSKKELSG